MKRISIFIVALGIVYLLAIITMAYAADPKFCGVVVHDLSTGKIHRSAAAIAEYKRDWPSPLPTTDWQIDHSVPLVCGGCDAPINMVWMHKSIKTCKAPLTLTNPYCKDRWEQRVFCTKPVTHLYVP